MEACSTCPLTQKAIQEAKEKGVPFSLDDWQWHHRNKFDKAISLSPDLDLEKLLKERSKVFIPVGPKNVDEALGGGIRPSRLSLFFCDKDRLPRSLFIGHDLALKSKVVCCIPENEKYFYDAIFNELDQSANLVFSSIRCIVQIPDLIEKHKADVLLVSPLPARPCDMAMLWGLSVYYNIPVVGLLEEIELNFYESGVDTINKLCDTIVEVSTTDTGEMISTVLRNAA
jgi:hypothetical protein